MKRGADPSWGSGNPKRVPLTQPCCVKVLISAAGATSMIGSGGAVIKEIQAQNSSKIHLSSKGEYYPGTDQQECHIQASQIESLNATIQHVLSRALEADGITEGMECNGRIIVPKVTASTVIGKGGGTIRELRQSTGCKIHIDETIFGSGDSAEQVMSFTGPAEGMLQGLLQVSNTIQELAQEPFFQTWAQMALAGTGDNAPVEGYKGKSGGKGKEKGGYDKGGYDKGGYDKGGYDKGGYDKGYDKGGYGYGKKGGGGAGKGPWDNGGGGGWDKGGGGGWSSGGGGKSSWGSANTGPASVLISAADALAPGTQGPQLSCLVAEAYVSGLIGKGGSGTKEISNNTGAKVGVREIEGDPSQKVVQITGPPIAAAAAYLRVCARLAEVEKSVGAKGGGKGGGEQAQAYEQQQWQL